MAVGFGLVICLGLGVPSVLGDQTHGSGDALAASPAALETLSAARHQVVALLPDWPEGKVNADEPEGSAVRLAPDGLLVTADHVLGRAAGASVRLVDGRVIPAEIVYRDAETDLAVLRAPRAEAVSGEGLTLSARDPVPGTPVCAIGNAFGLGVSVSCGVISAQGRGGIGFNAIEDFLQTDAAVNPGASGGALVDARGRLVGILSAIYTKSGDGDIGVNFAVSAPLVQRIVSGARAGTSVRRSLGAHLRATPLGPQRPGLTILDVAGDGPAARAGLRVGDVLLAIDGWPVRTVAALRGRLERADANGKLTLRRDGSELEIMLRF
ncbi:serine protease, S1-C subfamily, contains C-terminal PDZ domain [Stappia sp. ES.058]|nr:serine protease, S1-C subfamily, contains C-terminal PDZ domain [Stappia sp. ES.058]